MSQYQILPSQVLIVPGYTNEEIIAMSAKTGDTTASAIKNGTSSEDKTSTNNNTKSDSKTNTSSSSSSQAKTRMMKSRRVNQGPKSVNEYLVMYKKKSATNAASVANSFAKGYQATKGTITAKSFSKVYQGNKSTTTNTTKNTASTKSTSKTKTTKKTTKASKKTKTTSKTTNKSSSSSSSKKSNVNESSAATATESQVKIKKPKALLFSPNSVDYTPHRPDYEEFNSADGLMLIEKACDQFAELQLSLDVHQAMRIQENGTLELSADDKRPIDIITSGAPTALDKDTELGHFLDPADFTDSYIEIRRGFFDNYKNRPLTLISDLFPIMPVCYITDLNYNINEGEETAEYSITFREVNNTWG